MTSIVPVDNQLTINEENEPPIETPIEGLVNIEADINFINHDDDHDDEYDEDIGHGHEVDNAEDNDDNSSVNIVEQSNNIINEINSAMHNKMVSPRIFDTLHSSAGQPIKELETDSYPENEKITTASNEIKNNKNKNGSILSSRPPSKNASGTIQVSLEESSKSFTISWTQLTYRVKLSTFEKFLNKVRGIQYTTDSRVVLRSINGSFSSGQLTALMGPSGAGKSTLLECIAGMRLKGLDGTTRCVGRDKISIAFIPQHDHLYGLLTVREALMYASSLQHSRIVNGVKVNYSTADHSNIVDTILRQLNLDICANTKIDRISGGQQKRVSIAQELVSRPDILIMDEPTSGLDSSTCYQLMEMLSDLTSSTPIAIVMTIHQPSAKVFNMFQKVYMLSRMGKFIYEGTPEGVVPALARVNIQCSQFYNPADLLVEVASGDYGTEVIQSMAANVDASQNDLQFESTWMSRSHSSMQTRNGGLTEKLQKIEPLDDSLEKCRVRPVAPFTQHFLILLSRQFLVMVRDPLLGVLRFVFAFNIALTLGTLYQGIGVYNGCTPDIRGKADLDHLDEIAELIEEQVRSTQDNVGSLYFLLLYSCLANLMPMAVAIPMEIKIFAKERYNGWYKTSSYYMAKGIAEVPFIIGTNLVVVTLQFIFTNQPMDRYMDTLWVYFLVSLVAQTHGIMCGAFLMNNIVASVFTAPNTTVPLILFSGFFIRSKAMPILFQYASYCSYLRFGFEGFMIAIFGFNRCEPELTRTMASARDNLGFFLNTMFRMARLTIAESNDEPEDLKLRNQTETLTRNILNGIGGSWFNGDNQSGAMAYYDLNDSHYSRAIYSLLLTLFIGRFITYFILKWRGNLQK